LVLAAVKQRTDKNKARKIQIVGQKTRNTYCYSDIESNNMIRIKTKLKKSRPPGKEHPQTPLGLILQEKKKKISVSGAHMSKIHDVITSKTNGCVGI
jgi:hypothetical protein